MHFSFLTPAGLLLALAAALPLGALLLNERRARRVAARAACRRARARTRRPRRRSLLATVPVLLALALAQPVVQSSRTVETRTDAQIFYTFDTSVSMDASGGPHAPTRLQRAVAEAARMRLDLQDVPSGIATMTDRVLPNIFPTTDQQEFSSALTDTVGIDASAAEGALQTGDDVRGARHVLRQQLLHAGRPAPSRRAVHGRRDRAVLHRRTCGEPAAAAADAASSSSTCRPPGSGSISAASPTRTTAPTRVAAGPSRRPWPR